MGSLAFVFVFCVRVITLRSPNPSSRTVSLQHCGARYSSTQSFFNKITPLCRPGASHHHPPPIPVLSPVDRLALRFAKPRTLAPSFFRSVSVSAVCGISGMAGSVWASPWRSAVFVGVLSPIGVDSEGLVAVMVLVFSISADACAGATAGRIPTCVWVL